MMTSNNALIPDPDKEDILASAPLDWPLMRLGLRMCGWGELQTKYYLIGTPIIWWGGAASLLIGLLAFGVYVFRMQRRYVDMEPSAWIFLSLYSAHAVADPAYRRMGSLFVCRKDHILWLGPALL